MNEVTQVTMPLVVLVTITIALVGAMAALVKTIARNFERAIDQRFKQQAEVREAEQKAVMQPLNQLTQDVRQLKENVHRVEVELPREYVRREDHVVAMGSVLGRLDAVQAQGAHLLSLVARIDGANEQHKRGN